MKLSKIINEINFSKIINLQELEISSIHYNSKNCVNNSLFVAISGTKTDGNKYISDAIERGTKVIVTSNFNIETTPNITYLIVENIRQSLALISHLFYNNPAKELICIGITGTNGKTTTASLIKSILEQDKKKVGIIGTTGIFYNKNKIESTHTTPESLELAKILRDMVDSGIEYLVMEVSSHSIVQHRIFGINFKIAAFTNLTHEHLDFHNTIEEYAEAKKMLFDNLLPDSSIAIVNADDNFAKYMIKDCKCAVKFVGEKTLEVDYKISNVNIEKTKSHFFINNISINTMLTAYFNIQNAALSYAICNELNIKKCSIINGLANSIGAIGRLQAIVLENDATAYVDYAHTPDALEKALLNCKKLAKNGRLICIFGCGGDRDKTKRPIMGKISENIADIVILTNDNPRTENSKNIISDILEGMKDKKAVTILDRKLAIKHAVKLSCSNDIILVAGKGHENYQIIGENKHHFSDLEELMKYHQLHN